MKSEDLEKVMIPDGMVRASQLSYRILYSLVKAKDNMWYLAGILDDGKDEIKDKVLLEQEDIIDVLDDVLDIDQYLQDEEFQNHQKVLAERLILNCDNNINRHTIEVELGKYMRQQHLKKSSGKNFLALMMQEIQQSLKPVDIPQYLTVHPPKHFVPDTEFIERITSRIYEGTSTVAILGPTGSGKSATARYIGSVLNSQGYAVHIIDANARLEGDRLFDRDDFNADGTFILEGVLCSLTRETQKMGTRLLVILEEYNAFSDETRREFYRLFNDEDRFYPIQSSKDNKVIDKVDFRHVQFLITANPLSSDKYLTDDLKRLSNAETRRMVILYQDYSRNDETIKSILEALIRKKKGYQILSQTFPDFDQQINYQLGIDIFKELNRKIEGESLGHDVGYSSIADMLWTATLHSHQNQNYIQAIMEHILNAIPDIHTRMIAADRVKQAVGIHIPEHLVTQGS